jgi:aminocarboxymuconate-semialdehyde decarboxylase
MKIDIFCHIVPHSFYDRIVKLPERGTTMRKRVLGIPSIVDLELRFRMMDRFKDYVQVISMASPPIEALGDPKHSPELAEMANDGMAELVSKHTERFPGFVAS